MTVELVTGISHKTLRCALVGEEKSSKSTIISEACARHNGIIIDSEDGTGLMRDPKTPCYLIDTFGDLLEAYGKAVKQKPGLIAVDGITIPYKSWLDHWGDKYGDKQIPIFMWNTIKRPWRQFIHLIKCSHIPTIVTSRISYEMDLKSGDGTINKENWGAQAEKGFLYEMDIIIKTFKKDGKYYGTIDGARTSRHDKELAALVGQTFENITYEQHILPFAQNGSTGTIAERSTPTEQLEENNQQLEDKLTTDADEKKKQDTIRRVKKGEKKCTSLKISGWQDDDQISSTRITALTTDDLSKCPVEDLITYVEGLKNQVQLYNQQKLQEAS
jgi:hypothetical protein